MPPYNEICHLKKYEKKNNKTSKNKQNPISKKNLITTSNYNQTKP